MINYYYRYIQLLLLKYARSCVLEKLNRYRETIKKFNNKISIASNDEFQMKLDIKSIINVKYIIGF